MVKLQIIIQKANVQEHLLLLLLHLDHQRCPLPKTWQITIIQNADVQEDLFLLLRHLAQSCSLPLRPDL
ncbi:hypothetical protein FQN50_005034 [Emmonsiellopsis sp. PD_5]|nr:hypothetical protein FQN50_005034 [Emmonsiellopsis sp. PD_5]